MILKKSQAATEMIMLLAGALIVLLIIFTVNSDIMGSVNTRLRHTKAKLAVNDIGDAAELVYQQGIGSKTRTYITLPRSINSSIVSGRTISISFRTSKDVVYRNLGFDVSGTLPTQDGFYWICLETTQDYVTIRDCND